MWQPCIMCCVVGYSYDEAAMHYVLCVVGYNYNVAAMHLCVKMATMPNLQIHLQCRKVILPHKEEFKRKLKMKTKKSVDALRHYTVSYSVRKRNDISITKTIVSLDDGDSDSL